MMKLIATLISVLGLLFVPIGATEQRRPTIEPDMVRAMAQDDLGASIHIATSFEHPRDAMTVHRDTGRGQWGHFEIGTVMPRPRRISFGMMIAPRKWMVDGVAANWAPDASRAGRLIVEGHFEGVRCLFRGDIATNRTAVSGDVVCGGQTGRFDGVINRLVSQCTDFDGAWTGSPLSMVLNTTDWRNVRGSFANGGTITGELDAGRLAGRWQDASGQGSFSIRLASSEVTFDGSIFRSGDPKPRKWVGTCTGPRPRPRR